LRTMETKCRRKWIYNLQTATWSICTFVVKIIDEFHDVGAMEKKTCDTNSELLSSETSGCNPTWCWAEKEMGRNWGPLSVSRSCMGPIASPK
jgi:hypothetical protein